MIRIQNKQIQIPIIQGGMGVGVSLSSLAGNVALCGVMCVISAAHPGYDRLDFRKNQVKANIEALKYHIQRAKEIACQRGMVAVNIMVAGNHYKEYVQASIDEGKTLLAPIVSSGRAMKLILKIWDKRYQYTPDFVVIEGSDAGGHLGFKKEELFNKTCESLQKILDDVQNEINPYEEKFQKHIPIFVAGGIDSGKKIAEFMKLKATGVQIATPFIATYECDAHQNFKDAIIHANASDIEIVKSPTGFPGRAIVNDFVRKTRARGNITMKNCLHCMISCTPEDTPYCISEALIQSVKGNVNNGLIFVGSQAARIKSMKHVSDVIDEYMKEMEDNL
ncbi:MAG: nitronate monooxygenase family protein [Erysipelotrichaceae bacterium]|nr:nitronate monooxygenase family protein [Erysipelotrichaceae bacterium]